MKTERLIGGLWGFVLAFAVSFSAVACLATGFHMAVDLGTVALWCALVAAVSSLCYTLPLGALPVSALALTCGILWQKLRISVTSLIYRLTRQYDRIYGWGIVKLNMLTADDMEPTLWLSLCVLGAVIAIAVAWVVCRRKQAIFAFLPALPPVAACLVVTETVPQVWALYLLLLSLGVLMLSHTVRQQNEAQGNRVSLLSAGALALALLVLFATVPKESYTGQTRAKALSDAVMNGEFVSKLLGRYQDDLGVTDVTSGSRVQLRAIGVRLESQAEVMQVQAAHTGTLYLRGRALNGYDGTSWSQKSSPNELYWPSQPEGAATSEVRITTRYAHGMLYLPYYVKSMDLTGVSYGVENTKKLTEYSFTCFTEQADSGETEYPAQAEDALHLSLSVRRWAEPLAEEIVGERQDPQAKAQAIANYVRATAAYDTQTRRMPSSENDFVQWFLEDSDTGYCVHFASAATVLLQAAGIPARYVTGYMVDVEADTQMTVRGEDAHAWAEYWLPGWGWTVLEATPADTGSGEVPQTQPTQSPEGTIPAGPAPQQPGEAGPKATLDLRTIGVWGLVFVILLAAAVVVQSRLRLRRREQNRVRGSTNERALYGWQEAEYLAKLLSEPPDEGLFALAQKAKFSQHAITVEELSCFESYRKQALEKLRKRSVFRRLYDRLILALY